MSDYGPTIGDVLTDRLNNDQAIHVCESLGLDPDDEVRVLKERLRFETTCTNVMDSILAAEAVSPRERIIVDFLLLSLASSALTHDHEGDTIT